MTTGRTGFHMPTADGLRLVQMLSPAFPVGAFAHSQGLEQAISAGIVTDQTTLEAWVRSVLAQGAGRLDAAFLAAARDTASGPGASPPPRGGGMGWGGPGPQDDPVLSASLDTLAAHYLALLPSPGREREARELGAGFTAMTAAMGIAVPRGLPLPLAVGVATRGLQVTTDEVLALWLQGLAAQLVSVAVRFVPLGQAAGQAVLARLAPVIAALAEEAAEAPFDQAWSFTPGADIASIRQGQMETRIYRS